MNIEKKINMISTLLKEIDDPIIFEKKLGINPNKPPSNPLFDHIQGWSHTEPITKEDTITQINKIKLNLKRL